MKKYILHSLAILMVAASLTACKKDSTAQQTTTNYTSGQGLITGSGGTSFSVSNAATIFGKKADTVYLRANIDPTVNVGKAFIIAMVVKSTGTVNFNNLWANSGTDYNSGAVATYFYETTSDINGAIAHEYFVKSGSVNVTSLSATQISGTYTGVFGDGNNNNDPDITINGNFNGNF